MLPPSTEAYGDGEAEERLIAVSGAFRGQRHCELLPSPLR